jgi:hypothetical protein
MISSVVDIALCLDRLVPKAQYFGSCIDNTEPEYNSLIWNDERDKPSWDKIVEMDLIIAKELQKDKIKEHFAITLINGAGTYLGFKVDCKPEDISNWTSQLVLVGTAGMKDDYWLSLRDYDNQTRYLTVGQFKNMCLEVGSYYMTLYNKKWELQTQIDAAENKDEVFSITWDSMR